MIGSPDIDIMKSKNLPSISQVKKMYNIKFNDYSILIFHPVTTEYSKIKKQMEILIKTLKKSKKNYVVINPNNDMGSEFIFKAYSKLKNNKNFKIFESMRFEYFLTLLKKCQFIIGNSSAGIREAPFYGISAINIGTRQNKRITSQLIKNVDFAEKEILNSIRLVLKKKKKKKFNPFGSGKSFSKFIKIISKDSFWKTKIQKSFIDKASFDVTD